MYLHALQITNTVQSTLLRVQEICFREYGIVSAFCILPAYYICITESKEDARVRDIVNATQWLPLSLEKYYWHDQYLMLGVAKHTLLTRLHAVDTTHTTSNTHTNDANHTADTEYDASHLRMLAHLWAHACRAQQGFCLCYSAHNIDADRKKHILHALPSLQSTQCKVLQYVVSQWHGDGHPWWTETTQTVVAQTWLKLRGKGAAKKSAPPRKP